MSSPQLRVRLLGELDLRHLLHVLRRALPDADRFLEVTPRTLGWRDDAPSWVDVFVHDQ